MGLFRTAGRSFAKVAPKSWRNTVHAVQGKHWGKVQPEHKINESGEKFVNMVGFHTDSKTGKRNKINFISDQDSGDLYVANYRGEKTKYVKVNSIGDYQDVHFGSPNGMDHAKVGGRFSGLDATVKHLRDQGFDVYGMDKGKATGAKQQQFTGKLIDPRLRHNVHDQYYLPENFVRLDAQNDMQKSWRATQNTGKSTYRPTIHRKLDGPEGWQNSPSHGPGPKSPSGGTGSFFNGKPRFTPGDFGGNNQPPDNALYGPNPSQNQQRTGKRKNASWRKPTVNQKYSPENVSTPEADIVDVVAEDLPKPLAGPLKAIGYTPAPVPAKQQRAKRQSKKSNPAQEATELLAQAKPAQAETPATGKKFTAADLVALLNQGAKRNRNGESDAELAHEIANNVEDLSPKQMTHRDSVLKARAMTSRDVWRKREGYKVDPSKVEDVTVYKPGEGDVRIKGSEYLSNAFHGLANQESDPKLKEYLAKLAHLSSLPAAHLGHQRTVLQDASKAAETASGTEKAKIRRDAKKDADEIAQIYSNMYDPQGFGQATSEPSKLLGRDAPKVFTHELSTGATDVDKAAFNKATAQNNKDLNNTRGIGLNKFTIPSRYENLNASASERINQVPVKESDLFDRNQEDVDFANALAGKGRKEGRGEYKFTPDVPLSEKLIDLALRKDKDYTHFYATEIASRLAGVHALAKSTEKIGQDFDPSKAAEALMSGGEIDEGVSGVGKYTGDKSAKTKLHAAEQDMMNSGEEIFAKAYASLMERKPEIEAELQKHPKKKWERIIGKMINRDLAAELEGHVQRSYSPESDTHGYNVFTSNIKKGLVDYDLVSKLANTIKPGKGKVPPSEMAAIAGKTSKPGKSQSPADMVDAIIGGKWGNKAPSHFAVLQDQIDRDLNTQAATHFSSLLEEDPKSAIAQNMAAESFNNLLGMNEELPQTTALPFPVDAMHASLPQAEAEPQQQIEAPAPPSTFDLEKDIVAPTEDKTAKTSSGLGGRMKRKQEPRTPSEAAAELLGEHDAFYGRQQ